jgi:hypothetical protein
LKLRIQVFWFVTRISRVTDCRRFECTAGSRAEPDSVKRKAKRKINGECKDKVPLPQTGHEDPEEE